MLIERLKVHTVDIQDVSAERKTADHLLRHMKDAIRKMEEEFRVTTIGFMTDSSGESVKAREMLAVERPDLIILPCYAHQVRTQLHCTVHLELLSVTSALQTFSFANSVFSDTE